MNPGDLIETFPERLAERTRVRTGENREIEEGPVIYWMRNAARGHENPALNALIHSANRLDQALLVLHAITSVYPYASDRHHTFQLQGARDAHAELSDRDIPYVLYVQNRETAPQMPFREMVRKAGLLIVEEIPVAPFSRWGPALGEAIGTPVLSVDADCIVPMTWPDRFHDRAYKFRNATGDAREKRLAPDWSMPELDVEVAASPPLPFEPINPRDVAIPRLLAHCNVDHGIGPVPDRPGGAKAGYERWNQFRKEGLQTYHRDRNNPAKPGKVSRLSPYLHYGHVAPFRIAREAARTNGDGSDKFIDEFVTWRELAHHFCFFHEDYNRFSALPEWARKTLEDHADDERPEIMDWDRLSRAETGDCLWDLCQRSLLTHGELHNNVRMTWAKQLLQWTTSPRQALRIAVDLNNRYALDGRDPNSYGGILWCFGLFDRPYDRDRPIVGQVRPRSTDWHADRIDLDTFSAHVDRPVVREEPTVAVVGAGIAGTTAARLLSNHGVDVLLLEKSRGMGGRAATRRVEPEENRSFHFDHGAPYFTARTPSFRRVVQSLLRRDDVEVWNPRLAVSDEKGLRSKTTSTRRFVAVPGMSSLAGAMLSDVTTHTSTYVQELRPDEDRLLIRPEDEPDRICDYAVVTAPPPQAATMVEPVSKRLSDRCRSVRFCPVWSVLMGFPRSIETRFDAVFVNDGPLDWIARNSSKPGRPDTACWVLHATDEWTRDHFDADHTTIIRRLRQEWEDRLNLKDPPEPVFASAHRWRYARAETPLRGGAFVDEDAGVVVAGDTFGNRRIEAAFRSGRNAAGRILGLAANLEMEKEGPLF